MEEAFGAENVECEDWLHLARATTKVAYLALENLAAFTFLRRKKTFPPKNAFWGGGNPKRNPENPV